MGREGGHLTDRLAVRGLRDKDVGRIGGRPGERPAVEAGTRLGSRGRWSPVTGTRGWMWGEPAVLTAAAGLGTRPVF